MKLVPGCEFPVALLVTVVLAGPELVLRETVLGLGSVLEEY
jgi:hypothetical protein